MLKSITSLFALACVASVSAQSFTLSFNGNELTNGQSFEVGYTQPIPGAPMVQWESAVMTSSEGGEFVCEATSPSDNFDLLSICCGGECVFPPAKNETVVKHFSVEANTPLNLQIHRSSGVLATAKGDLVANVVIYPAGKPDQKFSYSASFVVKPASEVNGIGNVSADDEYVKVSGRRLLYKGHGQLSVYTILGTTMAAAKAEGEGELDLSHLAAGIYVYRLGSLTGKFIVR